jgi:uncharacterized phage protein (TIGR02220 family)
MRWFKHMTLTRSDERVAAYVSECGMEGYGFFWVVLETVALSMDKTGKCDVYYPLTYWVTQGQLHRTKIFRYLTALKSHGLLMVDFSGGMVLVKVPNLLKYRDEYTKRSGQTPDKLPTKYRDNVGTLSGQTPDQDTDTDTDTEEKKEEKKAALFPSGKPDITSDQKTERLSQKAQRRTEAIEVLNYLNAKAGRSYRPKDATLRPIIARLEDGATLKQCRQVIAKKHFEWKDKEGMAEYLRPKTLFGATNFEQYVGELVIVEDEDDVR